METSKSATAVRRSAQTGRFSEKQAEIISAASLLLIDRGIRGFTLADVAERTGLITQGVAYYFPRKDDLAAACIEKTVAILDRLATESILAPTAAERIAAFFRPYFTFRSRIATDIEPPIAPMHEVRALSKQSYDRVAASIQRMFSSMLTLFATPELSWMDEATRTGRAHFVLQCALSVPGWESSSDPADYARSGERSG